MNIRWQKAKKQNVKAFEEKPQEEGKSSKKGSKNRKGQYV